MGKEHGREGATLRCEGIGMDDLQRMKGSPCAGREADREREGE